MLYNCTQVLAVMWIESVLSGGWRLSFLTCNLLWPCSLIGLQIELGDSLIVKGFIFEVLSQSLKQREAEKMEITIKPCARSDKHLIMLIYSPRQ